MNRDGIFSIATVSRLACAIGVLARCASPAGAVLVDKYTFNNNTANDSIGGKNGIVVDNTGIAKYTGGAIDLSGNTGQSSDQDFSVATTACAYVDLPNGVFTSAIDTGTFGAASLEIWFTTQQNRAWAEAFVFGRSHDGENLSHGGGSYVAMIPRSGPNDFRGTTRDDGGNEIPLVATPPTPLSTGVKYHVVYTLDHNDTDGGTKPNGTGRLYLNGASVGSAEIATFLDSASLNDVNNWLGRSQWGDPLYDGLIDEFRIYNHALTPSEVTTSFNIGPDPAPLPVLVVNRDTGAVSLANQTAGNVQIKGYSVTSSAGALNPATWTSIDAGNGFDPDGTWTAQSSTSTNLAESVTGGTLDGGSLAPASSRGIGTPWRKSPYEDLAFNFTLGDNTLGSGIVQYTGTAAKRSDLNGDGQVTLADWNLFLPNSFTTFLGDTTVAAYLKGDLDGDKDNDYADFKLFKADFILANGAAAAGALIFAVPEPSSLAFALTAIAMLFVTRRGTRVR